MSFSKRFSLTAAGKKLLNLGSAAPARLSEEQKRLLKLVDSARGPEDYAVQLQTNEQWVESELAGFASTGWVESRPSVPRHSVPRSSVPRSSVPGPSAPRHAVHRSARINGTKPSKALSGGGFTSFFGADASSGGTATPTHSGFANTDFHIYRNEPEPDTPQPKDWFDRYALAREAMSAFLLRNLGELGPSNLAQELEKAGASEKLLAIFPRYKSFILDSNLPSGGPHLLEVGNLLDMR